MEAFPEEEEEAIDRELNNYDVQDLRQALAKDTADGRLGVVLAVAHEAVQKWGGRPRSS